MPSGDEGLAVATPCGFAQGRWISNGPCRAARWRKSPGWGAPLNKGNSLIGSSSARGITLNRGVPTRWPRQAAASTKSPCSADGTVNVKANRRAPASVNPSKRCYRLANSRPRSVSSLRMRMDGVGWTTWQSAAARPKCRVCSKRNKKTQRPESHTDRAIAALNAQRYAPPATARSPDRGIR